MKGKEKTNNNLLENHPVFNHPSIEPIFNIIAQSTEDAPTHAYLDYNLVTPNKNEANDGMGVLGLKVYSKSINFKDYEVYSNFHPKNYGEFISKLSRTGLTHLFDLGKQNIEVLKEKKGFEFINGSLEVKIPLVKQYVSFFKNPLLYIKDIFKPRFIKEFMPGQKNDLQRRKILSKILQLANVIAVEGRRGAGNTVIVNAKIGTILQDIAGFQVQANDSRLLGDSMPTGIYNIGSIAGLNIYVDHYMSWDDDRILVYRKGRPDEPGLGLIYKTDSLKESNGNGKHTQSAQLDIIESGLTPYKNYILLELDIPNDLI